MSMSLQQIAQELNALAERIAGVRWPQTSRMQLCCDEDETASVSPDAIESVPDQEIEEAVAALLAAAAAACGETASVVDLTDEVESEPNSTDPVPPEVDEPAAAEQDLRAAVTAEVAATTRPVPNIISKKGAAETEQMLRLVMIAAVEPEELPREVHDRLRRHAAVTYFPVPEVAQEVAIDLYRVYHATS